jgi:hypothetical protein
MKSIAVMVLAGILLAATTVAAQQPDRPPADTSRAVPGRPMTGAMMMRVMDSADARLDGLVRTMNQATGQNKVQAMEAVINELVAQRKMMRGHMARMMGHNRMSGHPEHNGSSMQEMHRGP